MLTKAEEAKEANSHAQVKDELQLEIHNYEIEKRSGASNLTLIEHLGKVGYLQGYNENSDLESYIIPTAKLNGAALGKGTSKSTGDVYVIEKESIITGNITKLAAISESDVKPITKVADESAKEDWLLKYYKTEKDSKILLNLTSITSTENNKNDNLVSFKINNTDFKCEKGMTLKQFILESDESIVNEESIFGTDGLSNYYSRNISASVLAYLKWICMTRCEMKMLLTS